MAARLHPVVAYMRGVLDGSIPACVMVRQAVLRHLNDLETGAERGLHFDRAAAEHVLQFFGFLKHSKGEWAGKPFILEPWQQFLLWVLFGWKRADGGMRRFRHAYIEVPRKNGKTQITAGIGLYLLVADGEPGAEVYSAATKRDQAKLCWGEAARMVKRSPSLSKMIHTWRSSSTLTIEATASLFMPLGADADTMDGLNVHGALIDELHAHPTSAVLDVLETGTGARRQPLVVMITTAGYDRQSICYQNHEFSRKVLSGSVVDDGWFAFMTGIDAGDEEHWDDPAVWAKANPNLGVSVKPHMLASQLERARQMPSALNALLQKNLNVWTQQNTRWISLELWAANGQGPIDEAMLEGCECYGGLDLSSVSDLTAWVMVFPQDEDPEAVYVVARFWCPEARLTAEDNRYRDQYQGWVRDGWLQTTPGDAVDYATVKKQVMDDAARFQLTELNVDRLFQGYQLSQELMDEGLTVFGMGQGFYGMAAPMKEFERRLLARKINHGGNPVLAWMADNVSVRMDPAGNYKPDKAKSEGKIDGIVALVMALDRAMRHGEDKGSVYEDRGLFSA